MKLKTIIFIAVLFILTAIFVKFSSQEKQENFKPLELNVGDVFEEVDYGDTMYVINYTIGDVTGDHENDMVIMVGKKDTVDSIEATKVDVVVYNTASQTFQKAGLKNYEGKNPRMQLADYTGDQVNDILLILENTDATKNIRIVQSTTDLLKEIWNRRDNRGLIFVGEVIDGVKAHLRCGKLSKEMYIELMDLKEQLVAEGKCNESGKMMAENKSVSTTSFYSVENIDLSGQTGLQTVQRMVAFPDNTILDEVVVLWKYENGKWQIVEARGNRVGVL